MHSGSRSNHFSYLRVALYDQFIDQWLERGKKRLGEKDLGDQVRSALCDEGLTLNGIDFS
jgi:hypothetical protein